MHYRINNTHGMTGGRWALTFASLDKAADELRKAMGWDEVWLSRSFEESGDDGKTTVQWCAYESEARLDFDDEGAHAPRIVEVKEEYQEQRWKR